MQQAIRCCKRDKKESHISKVKTAFEISATDTNQTKTIMTLFATLNICDGKLLSDASFDRL